MATEIRHTWFYNQSPEQVWDYLTRAELIEQWLMKSDFEPILGHEFQFVSKPAASIDFDGIVYCKVLEVIPFKKLSYSWKCGPGKGVITIDSIVIWTLTDKDGGTELLLENIGFKVLDNYSIFNAMEIGWLQNMQKITQLLNDKVHGISNP